VIYRFFFSVAEKYFIYILEEDLVGFFNNRLIYILSQNNFLFSKRDFADSIKSYLHKIKLIVFKIVIVVFFIQEIVYIKSEISDENLTFNQ
jgi:hypothetical protein